jgi:hypothetical protein
MSSRLPDPWLDTVTSSSAISEPTISTFRLVFRSMAAAVFTSTAAGGSSFVSARALVSLLLLEQLAKSEKEIRTSTLIIRV